jgi:hypothetical protein
MVLLTAVRILTLSSVILPVLASVRHSARSQRIANLVSNAVTVEQGFLKPSNRRPLTNREPGFRARPWMATLGSLDGRCPIEQRRAVYTEFPFESNAYLPAAGGTDKSRERDLDLPDRDLKRLCPPRAEITNQLSANPAGHLHQPTSIESAGYHAGEPYASARALQLTKRVRAAHVSPSGLPSSRRRYRKNINVKRVNC